MSDSTDQPAHPPQAFGAAAAGLDRPTYDSLKRALELGRWPDGRVLESRQREICMEAVVTWEMANLPPEARTGFVEENRCASDAIGAGRDDDAPQPLRILGDS